MKAAGLPDSLDFDVSLLPDEWWVLLLTDSAAGTTRYEVSTTEPITRTKLRRHRKLRGAGGLNVYRWEQYRHHYFLVTIPVQGPRLIDQTSVRTSCTVAQFKEMQARAFERRLEAEAVDDPFDGL